MKTPELTYTAFIDAAHQTPNSRLRFDALKFRDQFVLWAARTWISASSRGPTMPTVVEEGFEAGDLLAEKTLFHELLTLITITAKRTILFSPTHCRMVAPEEARFLSMLSAARQQGCEDYALHLLEEWLPEDTARRALPAARALAQSLFFKLRPRAVGEQPSVPTTTSGYRLPDPGIGLVH